MKFRMCEIVQEVDRIALETIKMALERECIKDYAYIVHNQDETRPHYHIALRFKSPQDSKYISQWFGVPEQMVCKVYGRWTDILNYLTHRNAEDKHRYQDDEVTANFDWQKEREHAVNPERIGQIVDGIVSGTIREYNYHEHVTAHEYIKFKQQIDNAYKYRADAMKGAHRSMEVVYITGESGTGKSTYAKQIAEDKKYSIFISSGSNDILDGYQGQDCLILDDLRPSSIGLSDLLKMLDNNTSSSVKSRYRNKVLECKMIIITTVLDIDTFFKNVFQEEREPMKQLKRRCRTHVRMTRDRIYISIYQPKLEDYGKEIEMKNTILEQYNVEEMTEEEQLEFLKNILGTGIELVEQAQEQKRGFEEIEKKNTPFE